MKRREFTQLMGVGLLASSLPVALAACQTNTSTGEFSPWVPLLSLMLRGYWPMVHSMGPMWPWCEIRLHPMS